jgi:hypothetical protein
VAVNADLRNWSFVREKLLSMTIQARRMFRKLGHIRKRRVAFANVFPIPGGKLMTRATRELLFRNVSGMRKARVVNRRWTLMGLRASLSLGGSNRQSKRNYQKCR